MIQLAIIIILAAFVFFLSYAQYWIEREKLQRETEMENFEKEQQK